jgi:hypothetical protein
LHDLLFDLEHGGEMFLRNVGWLSPFLIPSNPRKFSVASFCTRACKQISFLIYGTFPEAVLWTMSTPFAVLCYLFHADFLLVLRLDPEESDATFLRNVAEVCSSSTTEMQATNIQFCYSQSLDVTLSGLLHISERQYDIQTWDLGRSLH